MQQRTPPGTHKASCLWAAILVIVLTQCLGLWVEVEAAEEVELCKFYRTYRVEGCTGGRKCIKIREPVWEPCRRPSLTQRFKNLARTLFEYGCEKECTPAGEVRCKLREDRRTAFGVRG